jgi:hypothetical protein
MVVCWVASEGVHRISFDVSFDVGCGLHVQPRLRLERGSIDKWLFAHVELDNDARFL